MKKVIVLVSLMFIGGSLFAGNEVRIEELTKEGTELMQKKDELDKAINNIDIRLIQIQVILEELKYQDENKEK